MKTFTVKELVAKHKEVALAAKSPAELKAFIESIGCATKTRWNRAVAAIIEVGGIDYYAARGEQRAATAEQLRAQVTHEATLFVDAKASAERFAICGPDGNPIWFGRFFEDDQSFSYGGPGEQSACECAAARKAIWLASNIKEAVTAPALRLNLRVDAQWLCTLAGKAGILASDARRFNIELVMQWIPGTENPADAWTTASAHKSWKETDLQTLARPFDPDQARLAEETRESEAAEAQRLAEIESEKRAREIAAEQLNAAKAAGFESVEAHRAHMAICRDETEAAEKKVRNLVFVQQHTALLNNGRRFGCNKPITTLHQFQGCILNLSQERKAAGLPELTLQEIACFKAAQNFTNEVTQ